MVPIFQVHLTFLMLFCKCLEYAFTKKKLKNYDCCSIVCWRGWDLKPDVQGQVDGNVLDIDRQWGGGPRKLDNFHGRHICIVPNGIIKRVNWILK